VGAGALGAEMRYLCGHPVRVVGARPPSASPGFLERTIVPKRNYGQAKRQREASREQKKAEKEQRKLDRQQPGDRDDESLPPDSPEIPTPS
jgi:hypothetical protein